MYGIVPDWEVKDTNGNMLRVKKTKDKQIFDYLVRTVGEENIAGV